MPVRGSRRGSGQAGAAVVEFVVVVPMLALLLLAVVQVGLVLHVRSALAAAAAEGARDAAVRGGDAAVGVRGAREALAVTVAADVVEDVRASVTTQAGFAAVDVEVRARLPLVALLGPSGLVVHGHALVEG